jgi:uncharacterized protein (DUF3820 family)
MAETKKQELLLKVARTKMPYGRYKDRLLADLPEPYLVWFSQQGFPKGELGEMLSLMHEMKVNGLEYLLRPLWPKGYKRPPARQRS